MPGWLRAGAEGATAGVETWTAPPASVPPPGRAASEGAGEGAEGAATGRAEALSSIREGAFPGWTVMVVWLGVTVSWLFQPGRVVSLQG